MPSSNSPLKSDSLRSSTSAPNTGGRSAKRYFLNTPASKVVRGAEVPLTASPARTEFGTAGELVSDDVRDILACGADVQSSVWSFAIISLRGHAFGSNLASRSPTRTAIQSYGQRILKGCQEAASQRIATRMGWLSDASSRRDGRDCFSLWCR